MSVAANARGDGETQCRGTAVTVGGARGEHTGVHREERERELRENKFSDGRGKSVEKSARERRRVEKGCDPRAMFVRESSDFVVRDARIFPTLGIGFSRRANWTLRDFPGADFGRERYENLQSVSTNEQGRNFILLLSIPRERVLLQSSCHVENG